MLAVTPVVLTGSRTTDRLVEIADRFALPGKVQAVTPLGSGNVNDTYCVTVEAEGQPRFVLQRLNTEVFRQPRLVMANIAAVSEHVALRLPLLPPGPTGRRWEMPRVVKDRSESQRWVEWGEEFWRTLTFIDAAHTHDTIADAAHAREIGVGLGTFHTLISDLPVEQLADTLEGFHITPRYLAHYDRVCEAGALPLEAEAQWCAAFIEERRRGATVLEEARASGLLRVRPIHGDPKINNVMICSSTARAVAMVDLDTVKPGLVQYDIGDCLRSACNRLGEETPDWQDVSFDTDLCAAVFEGYGSMAREFLTDADYESLYDAIRLISFELGLRFFTDHLAGDVYFRTSHPGHNLERALVQFQLSRSIEAQEQEIRAIVAGLR
ncbi:MAG: phosphotransferase enzyme family protein [Cyanobacteriota bacterium]